MSSPIALFAFNRPKHLEQTLAALAANELASESDLHIFCDGPRSEGEGSICAEVVQIAQNAKGFKSVTVRQEEKNRGLASSIIAGVSYMIANYGQTIVLEDDLVTSPYFLRYMNDGLRVYADNQKVASIHGYCFPHSVKTLPETFFLKGGDCLGWGTWERAWKHFESDALALLSLIRHQGEEQAFNHGGAYDYTGMLEAAAAGKVSSWAIRWLASTWVKDMYTLYPSISLVFHNGSDGSGTHCDQSSIYDVPLSNRPIEVCSIPVSENPLMRKELCKFLRRCSGNSVLGTCKAKFKQYFPCVFQLIKNLKQLLWAEK